MASTCVWDSTTKAFQVTINAPGESGGTPGSASVQINAPNPIAPVTNRCMSSFKAPPPLVPERGFGFSWYQVPPPGDQASNAYWNVQGPAYGDPVLQFYIQPTYKAASGWKTLLVPPNPGPEGVWTITDPGGSTSIVISMIEPGGGGLSL